MHLSRHFSKIFILISFCYGLNLSAQNEINEQPGQQWVQYYGEAKLDNNWLIFVDGGFRWQNNFLLKSQFLVRTAIGYAFENGPTLSAGYAYLGIYRSDLFSGHEDRTYQEVKYGHHLGKLKVNHRVRIEQRFFNINNTKTNDVRFRYGINLKVLSFPLSKTNEAIKVDLNVGNELFFVAGNEQLPTPFSKNRFIISPQLYVNKDLSFALTWNRQFEASVRESIYNVSNVFWLQIRHKIAF